MKKFVSIGQLRHAIKYTRSYLTDTVLDFTGTVKLHGTNAAIINRDGVISFQSRNNIITPDQDNMGFATYFNDHLDAVKVLFNDIPQTENCEIILYGEWIGKGIQSKVAINDIEPKQFVIFAIKRNDEWIENTVEVANHEINVYNILEIDSYNIRIHLDDINTSQSILSEMVEAIDKECPWGKKFGISGHGEGLVFKSDKYPKDESLWFKVKGESHKRSSTSDKVKIEVQPEVSNKIAQFTTNAVNEDRLMQGIEYLKECHMSVDMDNIGAFLKWVSSDINNEEKDLMEEQELSWKDISKSVTRVAKKWFVCYIENEV